ncbi:glycosyltransferase family 2 protein [Pluralibacter gergoviae]|uniref:glycosyltransferase family 2 protein n=1 Tax=Pluralibacter gergoviae TaxID=61647 RepID=UPI00138F7E3F|nr:glycosyltransferase family 2 protein [Pluralibacter gergoviae]
MATYNGGKYINEQLQSIITCNSYNDKVDEFIVSDDESCDNTLSICQAYMEKDKRIKIIKNPNKGVISNFINGVTNAKADFLVLTDQDDVWEFNKIEILFDKMVNAESDFGEKTPLIIFSDSRVVDSELNIINDSFFKYSKADPHNLTLDSLLVKNCIQGCVMMLNRALIEKIDLKNTTKWIMHDWWFLLIAVYYGKIIFADEKLVKYRLHGQNVLGAKKKTLLYKISNIPALNFKFKQDGKRIIAQAAEFLNIIDNKTMLKKIPLLMIRYENSLPRKLMALINYFYFRKEVKSNNR